MGEYADRNRIPMLLIPVGVIVAINNGGDVDETAARRRLLNELSVINGLTAALGVPVRVPLDIAERYYPTGELPLLIDAERRHHALVLYQLGGTT